MGRPEYPKDLREFRQRFTTPQSCLEYLVQSRWAVRSGSPESTVEALKIFIVRHLLKIIV